MLYSLNLTESTINNAVTKIATAFGKRYQEMISELKKEANIHGDETSWRLNGKNCWLWAFVGKRTTIYEIDPTRSMAVPKRILDEYTGNITSDSYSAWNSVGATNQRCHIHYIRELKETIQYKNPGKEFILFAARLMRIFYASQNAAKITNKAKKLKAKKNLERRISAMISKEYSEENCLRFVKRLKRERMMLFTFLETGTDYHNNTAERAIRPNVIIRKITNGHRSQVGVDSHKILMSVKETCRMRGLNFHDYALEYLKNYTSKL